VFGGGAVSGWKWGGNSTVSSSAGQLRQGDVRGAERPRRGHYVGEIKSTGDATELGRY